MRAAALSLGVRRWALDVRRFPQQTQKRLTLNVQRLTPNWGP